MSAYSHQFSSHEFVNTTTGYFGFNLDGASLALAWVRGKETTALSNVPSALLQRQNINKIYKRVALGENRAWLH